MPYILENATKTVSNLDKLDKQAKKKNHLQTKLRLENLLSIIETFGSFIVLKLKGKPN